MCRRSRAVSRMGRISRSIPMAKPEPVSEKNRCKLAFASVWWAFSDKGIQNRFCFCRRDFSEHQSIPQQIILLSLSQRVLKRNKNSFSSNPSGPECLERKWVWYREGDYILIHFLFLTCHMRPGGLSICRWICQTAQLTVIEKPSKNLPYRPPSFYSFELLSFRR